MAKSVMVTGGAGMIGSNLVKKLVRDGWDVYVADNLWRGKLEYLNDEEGKAPDKLTITSNVQFTFGSTKYGTRNANDHNI